MDDTSFSFLVWPLSNLNKGYISININKVTDLHPSCYNFLLWAHRKTSSLQDL